LANEQHLIGAIAGDTTAATDEVQKVFEEK